MTACHPRSSRFAVVVTALSSQSCALHPRAPCPNGPCTVKTRCEGSNNVGSWRAQAPGSRVSCRSNPICPIHQPIRRGASLVARAKVSTVPLMAISARPLATACQIPCATTSGW
jgi:hypothetical protein